MLHSSQPFNSPKVMPVPANVDWTQIQQASTAGVHDAIIAERFGISRAAIRQKRKRQNWPCHTRLRLAQTSATQRLPHDLANHSAAAKAKTLSQSVTASEIVGENLEEYAKRLQNAVLPALVGQLEKATCDSPERFKPNNLKELQQSVTTIWKLTGRDRPEAQVTLNFGAISALASKVQVRDAIEAETVEVEEDATD